MLTMTGIRHILKQGCQDPECKGEHDVASIVLSPGCHVGAGVHAIAHEGGVTLECRICKRPMCVIAVAEREPEAEG